MLDTLLRAIFIQFPDAKYSEISEQFANLFMLIDQMMDYGIPIIHDPKVLSYILTSHSLFTKISNIITGTPLLIEKDSFLVLYKQFINDLDHNVDIDLFWRLPFEQVKNPEILMDVIEELHGRINTDGLLSDAYINGSVVVMVNLPKMPEISFQLKSTIKYSDISYHQSAIESQQKLDSVQIRFFAQNGAVSMVSYLVDSIQAALPFMVKLDFKDNETNPYLNVTINTEMMKGKYYKLNDFEMDIIFPEYDNY